MLGNNITNIFTIMENKRMSSAVDNVLNKYQKEFSILKKEYVEYGNKYFIPMAKKLKEAGKGLFHDKVDVADPAKLFDVQLKHGIASVIEQKSDKGFFIYYEDNKSFIISTIPVVFTFGKYNENDPQFKKIMDNITDVFAQFYKFNTKHVHSGAIENTVNTDKDNILKLFVDVHTDIDINTFK